jgi:hypothetical protein
MEGVNVVPGLLDLGVRLHRTRPVQSLLMKRYRNSVCTTAIDDLDLEDPDLSQGLYPVTRNWELPINSELMGQTLLVLAVLCACSLRNACS